LKNKIKLNLLAIFFYFFLLNISQANFQEQLINKYKEINTLSFDFTQKIGDKIEIGNCYIKYPLLMKCEYPKKKKLIIANGKTLAIVKNRYKKIYQYPLKKTPLFYILNKENILDIIHNYEPSNMDNDVIEYELTDSNSNKINIFFDKNSLLLSGWKTIDAYSNEVNFLIENIKTNIFVENKIFKIPKEEDL
jgi:outer membrane lipoprotein-sorting protein|tara:strand:- start:355 stop:930 length:576 start_codon:yes stop_codon:yes gene_type:complete